MFILRFEGILLAFLSVNRKRRFTITDCKVTTYFLFSKNFFTFFEKFLRILEIIVKIDKLLKSALERVIGGGYYIKLYTIFGDSLQNVPQRALWFCF